MSRPTIAGLTAELRKAEADLRRSEAHLREQGQLLDAARDETTNANAANVELSEQLADVAAQKEASDRLLDAAKTRENALREALLVISQSSRWTNSVDLAKRALDEVYPHAKSTDVR